MKFTCPKCSSRYSIKDEKVPPGKTLRFTCKKCNNVIRLRRRKKETAAAAAASPKPEPLAPHSTTRVASIPEINRLAEASRAPTDPEANAPTLAARQEPEQPENEFAESTRVASLGEINRVKKASRDSEPEQSAPPAAVHPFAGNDDWYVLVAGQQKGPLQQSTIEGMLAKNEVDRRTYAWREGMQDWVKLSSLDAFKEAANATGDASWRVVKPKDAKSPPAKKQKDTPAKAKAAKPAPMEDQEATVAMDNDRLRDEVAKTKSPDETQVAARPNKASPDECLDDDATPPRGIDTNALAQSDGPSLNDVAEWAALSGEPTGEKLEREKESERETRELGSFTPFGDDDSVPDELFQDDDSDSGVAPVELSDRVSATDYFAHDAPPPVEVAPGYQERPPGEATRVFMAASGIYKRRRHNKVAAVVGGFVISLLLAIISADIAGIYTIPGMGLMYDVTGMADPNVERAIERTETRMKSSDLSDEERAKLREKLLGLGTKKGKKVAKKSAGSGRKPAPTVVGITDKREMKAADRDMLASVFSSKKERKVQLADASAIRTPNLPDGLTQASIYQVITESSSSMNLCYAQSMRAGENVSGKMEVELTIIATGEVSEARIYTAKFKNSTFGNCTAKTVRRWRFPRFNGTPVTVVFPYILSAGF